MRLKLISKLYLIQWDSKQMKNAFSPEQRPVENENHPMKEQSYPFLMQQKLVIQLPEQHKAKQKAFVDKRIEPNGYFQ